MLFVNVFAWTEKKKSFNKEGLCTEAKELKKKKTYSGFQTMLQTKSKPHFFFSMKSEIQH
jgi:hypothetical protein